MIFNRVFHYKPSILGYPYFWKHHETPTSCHSDSASWWHIWTIVKTVRALNLLYIMRRRYMRLKEPMASPRSAYILISHDCTVFYTCIESFGFLVPFEDVQKWKVPMTLLPLSTKQIESWALVKDHCVFICYIYTERGLIICTYNIHVRLLSLSLSMSFLILSICCMYISTYVSSVGRIYSRW